MSCNPSNEMLQLSDKPNGVNALLSLTVGGELNISMALKNKLSLVNLKITIYSYNKFNNPLWPCPVLLR